MYCSDDAPCGRSASNRTQNPRKWEQKPVEIGFSSKETIKKILIDNDLSRKQEFFKGFCYSFINYLGSYLGGNGDDPKRTYHGDDDHRFRRNPKFEIHCHRTFGKG